MAKLCLNMIVKNEADKITRCLESVAPYISTYAILDTGSTDGTPEIIQNFFAEYKEKAISGVVEQGSFQNFEQARNDALRLARTSPFSYDYILLVDADMELKVDDPHCFDNLTDTAYDVVQTAGGTSYYNRRLVRRDQTGNYIGVTHEYLDVGGGSQIKGAAFIDHADGTNRKDKFKRDILLLLTALQKEPNNGRYMYYLAQSYRDAGQPKEAATWYKKRAEMGGWEEEAWSARINYAHCLNAQGDTDGFIRELLFAYNFRPTRAETLYDLARYYREHDQQKTSLLFSVEGMKIPYPTDVLFVTDHVYETGLKEEFAICAFYHPEYRDRGYRVCSDLAIDPKAYPGTRHMARHNLYYYLKPLTELCPSFDAQQIKWTPPDSYTPLNPSITNIRGQLYTTIRTVNYIIDKEGRYQIKGTNGEANSTNPIHTRNFLARVTEHLSIRDCLEVLPPAIMPKPAFDLVVGFEDMRIFEYNNELWSLSNLREMNREGWCEQTLARIEPVSTGYRVSDGFCRIFPKVRQHEKNWMPWVEKDSLIFVYKLGTFIDTNGEITQVDQPPFATEVLSGGGQVISFNAGWLAIVHESKQRPDNGQRYYQHRFVWWDAARELRRISKAFVLHDRQIEFAAGLAWHPDMKNIVVSYGIRDCEAWLAKISLLDIVELLYAQ